MDKKGAWDTLIVLCTDSTAVAAASPMLCSWGEVSAEEEEYSQNIHLTRGPLVPRLAPRIL